MKTAIYIEDGLVQLVLTPDGEFEKNCLSSFTKKPLSAKIHEGTFYDCRGGWVRQSAYYPQAMMGLGGQNTNESSLILVSREADLEPESNLEVIVNSYQDQIAALKRQLEATQAQMNTTTKNVLAEVEQYCYSFGKQTFANDLLTHMREWCQLPQKEEKS